MQTIKSIIISILRSLKMSRLGKFIVNTDYSSLKIIDSLSLPVTFPQVVIAAGSSYSVEYTYSTLDGVYFEIASARISLLPGKALTGSSVLKLSNNLTTGNNSTFYEVIIEAYKKDATTYAVKITVNHPSIQGSTASITMPSFDININLNLLVPSEQQ